MLRYARVRFAIAMCAPQPRRLVQFMYMLMIVWGTIVALVMRYWGNSLDFNFYSFHGGCTGGRCDGVQGVYRCSFALTVFFLFMALTSRCLPGIQRGGWMWKYIILAVLFVCAFLIPNSACPVICRERWASHVMPSSSVCSLLRKRVGLDLQNWIHHLLGHSNPDPGRLRVRPGRVLAGPCSGARPAVGCRRLRPRPAAEQVVRT